MTFQMSFESLRKDDDIVQRLFGNAPRAPLIILLGGAWSSGKSTSAIQLSSALGISNVVHTDVIRSAFRILARDKTADIVKLATYETWRLTSSSLTPTSMLQGFRKQCEVLFPLVTSCFREALDFGKDTVIEGLHLMPSLYCHFLRDTPHLYMWLDLDEEHFAARVQKRCLTTYRHRSAERYMEDDRRQKIIMLNTSLRADAERSGVPVVRIDKDEGMKQALQIIRDHILRLTADGM